MNPITTTPDNMPPLLENVTMLKHSLASMMSIMFRQGALHADRGWIQALNDSNGVATMTTYRNNLDDRATWQGILDAATDLQSQGNPDSFKHALQSVIVYATQRINEINKSNEPV